MSILSKSFSPNFIADGGITTLTFTVNVDVAGGPIVFDDLLPSNLVYAGNPVIPPFFVGSVTTPPIGTNGTISVARPGVPIGIYIFQFDITNILGQINPGGCNLNPQNPAFTNQSSNITNIFPPSFTFDGVASCLTVGTCPVIEVFPPTMPNGTVGEVYGPIPIGSMGGTPPYTLSPQGELFPGVSLVGATVTGIPTTPGIFMFNIISMDVNGCSGFQPYTITISSPTPSPTRRRKRGRLAVPPFCILKDDGSMVCPPSINYNGTNYRFAGKDSNGNNIYTK